MMERETAITLLQGLAALQNRAGCWMRVGAGGETGCYRFRRRGLPDCNANLNILLFIWGKSNNGIYKNRRGLVLGEKDAIRLLFLVFPFLVTAISHLFHFVIISGLVWKHWFAKPSTLDPSSRHYSVLSKAWILLHSLIDLCSSLL